MGGCVCNILDDDIHVTLRPTLGCAVRHTLRDWVHHT